MSGRDESQYISDLRSSAIYYGPSIDGCSITAKRIRSMEKVCKREAFGMIRRLGLWYKICTYIKLEILWNFYFRYISFMDLETQLIFEWIRSQIVAVEKSSLCESKRYPCQNRLSFLITSKFQYVNSCPPSKDSTKEMNHGQDGSLFADSSFVFIFSKGSDGVRLKTLNP